MLKRRNMLGGIFSSVIGLLGIKSAESCDMQNAAADDFAKAIQLVRKEMQNDEGLWIAYQSNIAMCLYDNGAGDVPLCGNYADYLMGRIFEAPRLSESDSEFDEAHLMHLINDFEKTKNYDRTVIIEDNHGNELEIPEKEFMLLLEKSYMEAVKNDKIHQSSSKTK